MKKMMHQEEERNDIMEEKKSPTKSTKDTRGAPRSKASNYLKDKLLVYNSVGQCDSDKVNVAQLICFSISCPTLLIL